MTTTCTTNRCSRSVGQRRDRPRRGYSLLEAVAALLVIQAALIALVLSLRVMSLADRGARRAMQQRADLTRFSKRLRHDAALAERVRVLPESGALEFSLPSQTATYAPAEGVVDVTVRDTQGSAGGVRRERFAFASGAGEISVAWSIASQRRVIAQVFRTPPRGAPVLLLRVETTLGGPARSPAASPDAPGAAP